MIMPSDITIPSYWMLYDYKIRIVSASDVEGTFYYEHVDPSKDKFLHQVHCSWLRRCKWEHDIKTNIEVLSLLHKKRC